MRHGRNVAVNELGRARFVVGMGYELPRLLDGADEPVTVAELEEVVHRAGQRRRATLVAGAAMLLAVGGVGGALARGPSSSRGPGFAASTNDPKREAAASNQISRDTMLGYGIGGGGANSFTKLFRREANGIVVRAYKITLDPATFASNEPATSNPACAPPTTFYQAGLSNEGAVGMAGTGGISSTGSIEGKGEFGVEEGSPATWVIVRAAAGVATIRVSAGSTTDSMTPEDGIALLVLPGQVAGGVIDHLAADGKVVKSEQLVDPAYKEPDPACFPIMECASTTPDEAGKVATGPEVAPDGTKIERASQCVTAAECLAHDAPAATSGPPTTAPPTTAPPTTAPPPRVVVENGAIGSIACVGGLPSRIMRMPPPRVTSSPPRPVEVPVSPRFGPATTAATVAPTTVP